MIRRFRPLSTAASTYNAIICYIPPETPVKLFGQAPPDEYRLILSKAETQPKIDVSFFWRDTVKGLEERIESEMAKKWQESSSVRLFSASDHARVFEECHELFGERLEMQIGDGTKISINNGDPLDIQGHSAQFTLGRTFMYFGVGAAFVLGAGAWMFH